MEFCSTFTDILMNVVGVFLWVAVGATALHYWSGYLLEHKYQTAASEREVSTPISTQKKNPKNCPSSTFYFIFQVGLAMGSLCILSGAAYLIDSVLAVIFVIKAKL